MYASRSSGMACRSRMVATRMGAARLSGHASRLVSARGFSQTLVSHQKKGDNAAPAPAFKIDEAIDEYQDVTASNEQLEKNYREPPVQVTGKHGEYASTLYATASVLSAVEAVERDLQWLQEASETVPMFQQFLSTGLPDKKIQRRLLQGVLKGANFHRLTQKFIVTELMEAGELKLLPDIVAAYGQIMKAHRKEVPVIFTFASLPDKDFLARQIERVKKYRLDADATPQWEFRINPALIGGFIIEVGSNFKANFSLATQFEHMRHQLKQAEDKWERVRPKDLQIDHFDTSKLFDLGASIRPGNVSEEDELELLEQVRGLDFNKLKQIKELDLAQHEKHLLKKYNIADNDHEGKNRVKAKIEQLKKYKELNTSFLGEVLKKHQPETYKKYQSVF